MSPHPEPHVNQVIAGRYRLERPLAQGGMGSVWIAWHLQLDVRVAVKFMMPEVAAIASARERFEREAKAAARLKSSHIVQVTDYGIENQILYLVMDLLVGEDLSQRLDHVGRLPLPAVAKVLGQACKGLALAHEAGIVHRDLKPANLFLAREGDEEVVKILDFGIAKSPSVSAAGTGTKTGAIMGSPNYMSPEQIVSTKTVDWRTDVWALGVIAFRCLTGCEVFKGDEPGQVLVNVCSAPIPRPSSYVPELGPAVDQFFETALAREVDRRFQRVQDFAAMLEALSDQVTGRLPTTSPNLSGSTGTVPAATNHLPIAIGPAQRTELTGSLSQLVPGQRPAARRGGVVLGIVLSGLALLGVAGGFVARAIGQRRPSPSTVALTTTPAALPVSPVGPSVVPEVKPEPTAVASVAPMPEAAIPPAVSAPPVAPSALPSASTDVSSSRQSPRVPLPAKNGGMIPRTTAPPSAPNCNPNYVLNAKGVKVFKPECFK